MKTNKMEVTGGGQCKLKLLAAVAVLAIAFAVFAAVPAVAEDNEGANIVTYFVDGTNGDDINDGKSAETAFKTVEHALSMNDATNIEIVGDITVGTAINITKDIVINGNGKTITAKESTAFTGVYISGPDKHVLNVTSSAKINDLVIDAAEKACGGVNVYAASGNDASNDISVTLNKISIKDQYGAGFILNGDATVDIKSCSVNSTVETNWGGINADGAVKLSVDSLENLSTVYSDDAANLSVEFDDETSVAYKIAGTFKPDNEALFYGAAGTDSSAMDNWIDSGKGRRLISAMETYDYTLDISQKVPVNSEVSMNGNFNVTVNNLEIDTLKLGLNTEVGGEPIIVSNIVVESAPSSGDEMDLTDYPQMNFGGVMYTIVPVEFTGAGIVNFGIVVNDVEYTGEPVTKKQVNPQVYAITDGVDPTLYLNDVEFIGEPGVNVGTYYISATVNVKYSYNDESTTKIYNKNVTVKVPYNITPLEPTAEVELEGWDVKQSVNEPTFVYTADKTYTGIDELPEGCTVKFILIAGDKTEYTQSTWNTITVNNNDEPIFTLKATFSAWGNYAEVTAEFQDVKLTNVTDMASELVFGEVDETVAEDLLGMSEKRLQDGITFVNPDFRLTEKEYTVAATGTVFYLASYPGFWGEAADKPGYYIAFTATGSNDLKWADATMTINGKEFSAGTLDGHFVLYLGNDVTDGEIAKTFEITFDQDGAKEFYVDTEYTLTVTATADTMKYTIMLIDEFNVDIKLAGKEVGSKYRLPAGAGVDSEFIGWQATTTDGEEKVFNHDSYFVVSDEYADSNGIIVLVAVYGEVPDPELTPETPSENILVSVVSTATGVDVYFVALDDGYIPAGEMTVTYTYTYYDDFFGAWTTATADVTVTVEESTSKIIIEPVDLSSEEHFADITYVQAQFGDFESEMIVYTPVAVEA